MKEIEKLLVDLQTIQDRAEVLIKDLSTQLHREENVKSPVVRALRGLFDSMSAVHTSINQNLEAIKSCKDAWEALDRHW